MNRLPVFVFSGPSGAGKSTLLQRLMANHPGRFGFSVSHTTRKIRPGEVHGKDYFYTDKDSMLAEIAAGKFLEYAEFAGNLYGTSRYAVESVIESGKICILDVEIEGVKSIHAIQPPIYAKYILIIPPSIESLEKRLRDRGTETEESIQNRLTRARQDIALTEGEEGKKLFTSVIVNNDLEVAYQELERIVHPFIKCTEIRR